MPVLSTTDPELGFPVFYLRSTRMSRASLVIVSSVIAYLAEGELEPLNLYLNGMRILIFIHREHKSHY